MYSLSIAPPCAPIYAAVAQLVERRSVKPWVGGSIPFGSAKQRTPLPFKVVDFDPFKTRRGVSITAKGGGYSGD